jgi:hypothetical protein
MDGPDMESLQDLAPGLLHELANALFAVQGRAQLLAAGAERDAILAGVRRGQDAVQIARWICGEGGGERVPAGAFTQKIGEFLRVQLRDQDIALECAAADAGARGLADPVALGRLVAATCRALAPSLAGGGRLCLSCRDDDGALAVAVRVEPAPGSLRYPLAEEALRRRLQRELDALGAALAVAPPTLTLRWPVSAGLPAPGGFPESWQNLDRPI